MKPTTCSSRKGNDMTEKSHKDGRTVLVWILAFFLTFIAVDAFFVYKAVTTHTGVVDQSDGK